jgi:hypothetical protein
MENHTFSTLSGNAGDFRENVRSDNQITNKKSRNENQTQIGQSCRNNELYQKTKARIPSLKVSNTPNYAAFGLLLHRFHRTRALRKTQNLEAAVIMAESDFPFPANENELYILPTHPSIDVIWKSIRNEPDAFTTLGVFRQYFSRAWGKPGITKNLFKQWKNRAYRTPGLLPSDLDGDHSEKISYTPGFHSCSVKPGSDTVRFKSKSACDTHITKHVLDSNEGHAWFNLRNIPELYHLLPVSDDPENIWKDLRRYKHNPSRQSEKQLRFFYRCVIQWAIRDAERLGWQQIVTDDHVIRKVYLSSSGVFVIQTVDTSEPFIESAYFPGLHSQYKHIDSNPDLIRKHSRRTKPRMITEYYSGYGNPYQTIYNNFITVVHCIHRTNGSRYAENGYINPLRKAYTHLAKIVPNANALKYPVWREIVDRHWH